MHLQEILNRKGASVRTIAPEATADEAVAELVRHNIGSLMVCQSLSWGLMMIMA